MGDISVKDYSTPSLHLLEESTNRRLNGCVCVVLQEIPGSKKQPALKVFY